MRNKYIYSFVMLLVVSLMLLGATKWYLRKEDNKNVQQDVTIVTSFYPMYVACDNLIGNLPGISLENLSEPQTGCLHDFQLTPEDMILLSNADVFVINGAGAEHFLTDVIKEYPDLKIINASGYEQEEEEWMHAWMSPHMYITEVESIATQLRTILPEKQEKVEQNKEEYLKKLTTLEAQMFEIAKEKQTQDVILFSEVYEVLADALGLTVKGMMDLDEERQISSGEIAEVVKTVQDNESCFIIAEELYGKEIAEIVAQQTGVNVIYLDTLTRGAYDKDRYVTGMQKNINLLKEQLLP